MILASLLWNSLKMQDPGYTLDISKFSLFFVGQLKMYAVMPSAQQLVDFSMACRNPVSC